MKKSYMIQFSTVCILLIFTAFSLFVTPVSAADEKTRIAILDLRADGVPGKTARTVGNMIRSDLVNTGKFTVVERTQMDLILKEQGFQQTGCTDQECAVQIGKVLSVRKMLIGEVSEVTGSLYITVRIVDVERGEVDYAEKEVSVAGERMDEAVTRLTGRLSKRITREKPAVVMKEEKKPPREKKPSKPVMRGNIPEGLMLSFNCFLPLASDFSDSYPLLMGGSIGYLYPFGNYLALNGSVSFLTAKDESGDTRSSFTGGVIGARAGMPLFGFMYPYLGAAARGNWIYEKGKSDSAGFFAWGFDGLAGVAFMVSTAVGINVEGAYHFGRVADDAGTDVSGIMISGGMLLKIW